MAVLKYKDNNEWKESTVATAYEVSDIPAPTQQELTFSGDLDSWDRNGNWDWFITKYGDKIKIKDITNCNYMFYLSNLERVPFTINCAQDKIITMQNMIGYSKIKVAPTILNCKVYQMLACFGDGHYIRIIPDNYFDTWDFSKAYKYGNNSSIFNNCYSLRKLPLQWLNNILTNSSSVSYNYFNYQFVNCYVLDELINLPIANTLTYTSNLFQQTFNNCYRLKRLVFAQTDAKQWKNQVIDLSKYVGYSDTNNNILNYNSGITEDKRVYNDTDYQALKNDPDWWTKDYLYSRYNKISAIETINSLPDTSAYLATAGGTNTIKFKGEAGSATDGGAINTMTEEEIAVATAKGWTVSLV